MIKLMKKLLILLALGILVTGSIYAENEGPSDVDVDSSTNILMLKKPTDSSYQQFTIKGVNWSPATQSPQTGIIYDATTPYGFFFNWPNRWPQGHEVMRYWQRNELFEHYVKDIPLISGMNANTVRILNNLGSTLEGYDTFADDMNKVLEEFWRQRVMVIMTVAMSKEDIDSQKYLKVVNAHKNHPAILMWAIGNEWNFNKFYPDTANPLDAWHNLEYVAEKVNEIAEEIKAIDVDPHHPVCSILGDSVADFPMILQKCPAIDIWGINIYRGADFVDSDGNDFFDQWKEAWGIDGLAKPFFFSEFGIDSLDTENCTANEYAGFIRADNNSDNDGNDVNMGYDDQERQANVDLGLWKGIEAHLSTNGSEFCLGGVIHEFNDSLWKVGNYHVGLGGLVNYKGKDNEENTLDDDSSYDEYNDEGYIIDSIDENNPVISEEFYTINNEEHFGLVTADRTPKQAYTAIKEAWQILLPQPPVVRDDGNYTIPNTYGSVQLEFHWSTLEEDIIDEFQYKITEGSIEGTVISDWKSVGLSDWIIAGVPTVNGKTYYCSVKAINKAGEAIGYSDGVTVDKTKPTGSIQITKVLPDTPCSSKAELLLNAIDTISGMGEGAQMSFSFDGSTWQAPQAYSPSLTLALMPGAQTLYVIFQDVAGNWSDVYSTAIIYPDKTPPQITHTPITSAPKYYRTPKYRNIIFTANVIDLESGIKSVTLCWRKRILRIWGYTWSSLRKVPLTSLGNNTYQAVLYSHQTGNRKVKYYLEAKDKAGNVKKTGAYIISR